MGKIESIKQKICQLDAGSFQNLCDSYLYKIGYPNIVSLGGEAGTRKTTPGTPDTYFILPNGKYIFVEYTTQKERLLQKSRMTFQNALIYQRQVLRMIKSLKLFIVILHQILRHSKIIR